MRWTIGATDMGDALCPKLIYENKTEVTETPETIHNVLVNYGTPPSKITVWTVVSSCVRPGCSVVRFRFVGVVSAMFVLLALRALPCVALRCLAFVSCVPVGLSFSSTVRSYGRTREKVKNGVL